MTFSKYINIPYKHHGRDFGGVDCYGLVWLIFKEEKEIILPDVIYDKWWSREGENHIVENIDSLWDKVQVPYKRFDCPIFYLTPEKNVANHIGLFISPNEFIQVRENKRVEITRLDKFWKSRLYNAIRYKE